jgi:hypothetical protein
MEIIKKGKDIGRHTRSKYIWHTCTFCGKERWVTYLKGKPRSLRCSHCTNKKPPIIYTKPPEIGEVRSGPYINKCRGKYIWLPCEICGFERWIRYIKDEVMYPKCRPCSAKQKKGPLSKKWQGGRYISSGYVCIYLQPNSPFYSMAQNKKPYIMEHRLIMAQHLGRCLEPWELVHHKNGIKDDNRIENLELTANGKHSKDHSKGYMDGYRKGFFDGANAKINELLKEIKALKEANNVKLR